MREIYEFNPDDAYRFANDHHIPVFKKGDQLHFKTCPYCYGGKGHDQRTFAIDLKTGKFNCLRASCGAKGNMLTLAKDFDFSLGDIADEYLNPRKQFKPLKNTKPETKSAVIKYLKSRGISQRIAEKYNIGNRKDEPNVLAFPFYDENDVLTMVKYRKTDFDKAKDKNKEWSESNCKPILFGMNHCNPENKTLVLTEGQIDSLSVAEAGIENAVSVPNGAKGFTWIPYCWNFLTKFDELIVFGDYENGNITLLPEMRSRFHGRVKHVRPEDYKDCKDANDILRKYGRDAVRLAVEQAIPLENPRLKWLKDVERVELFQMEQFSSGIKWLDRLLGGFYFGQVILLTGERGEGKSTLASQFGAFAIEAGYQVCFYSGEMGAERVKDWLELQAAGAKNINKIEREDRGIFYSIREDVLPKIMDWYGDKALVYDNRAVEDADEDEALTKTLENAIQQYGCRVLIVDNLMSAMEDDLNADLNQRQTAFVRSLTKMARRFNVLIFLIAHPRKNTGSGFSNDDVSGSGNITNLVDVVIRYSRPDKDKNAKTRVISVLKNRLTGQIDSEGITLYFQESSKRISPLDGVFDMDFSWDKEDGFYVLDDDEDADMFD